MLTLFLLLLVWSGAVMARILYVGSRDAATRSDVIIVLGAAVRNGRPSPAFAARIRHGIELWKRGVAPKLLFTGGLGHGDLQCESEVARDVAMKAGVPASAILVERQSHYTWENLSEARDLMHAQRLRTAVIVSDPDHLLRSSMMADDLKMPHVTSPTPYTVFQTWKTRVPFLLGELFYCHTHRVSLWVGRKPVPGG